MGKQTILLNSITPPSELDHVQERLLPLELSRIPDGQRRSEEDLWQRFEDRHSMLLAAILAPWLRQ